MYKIRNYVNEEEYLQIKRSLEHPTVSYTQNTTNVWFTEEPNYILAVYDFSLDSSSDLYYYDTDKPDWIIEEELVEYDQDSNKATFRFHVDKNVKAISLNLVFSQDFGGTAYGVSSVPITYMDFSHLKTKIYDLYRMPTTLTAVNFGKNFDTSLLTSLHGLFSCCTNLPKVDLSMFNTRNVTDMRGMFDRCRSLTTIDLSSFDTSNVVDMQEMFHGCNNLLTIAGLDKFDTSNVNYMYSMFLGCTNLTSLDLSSFDTSNVINMGQMFLGCNNITSIKMLGDVSKVEYTYNMFNNLSQNCTFIYNCKYEEYWNNILPKSDTLIAQCQQVEITNKLKFIENGVELTTGNFTVNGSQCVYDSQEKIWSVTYVDNANEYNVIRDNNVVGVIRPNKLLQYVFIGTNNESYNCFNIIETINVDSTTEAYNIGSFVDKLVYAITIDDVPVTYSSKYTFNTIGEHIVKILYDVSKIGSLSYAFNHCESLTSIDLSSLDTSNVTNMDYMFNGCSSLTSLNLSSFDTSKVISMNSMFGNCDNLTSLDLRSFDTSMCSNMSSMFYNCTNLTSLDLCSFDTSNVIVMDYMFYNCKNLTSLDLSSFDTSMCSNMSSMFSNCAKLTSLDLSSFDTSKVIDMNNMFYNCTNLTSITMTGDVSSVRYASNVFSNISPSCTLTLCEKVRESWEAFLSRLSTIPANIVYRNC